MGRKKEMYLIIDTETTNTMDQPLVYDIGYAICDRFGSIVLKRSFVVAETFIDYKDVMKSAYYAEKIPMYWDKIKNDIIEIKSIFNIRKQLLADIKEYRVKKVGAYNMNFDLKALNTTIRYFSKSVIRHFFPFGMKYICIWNMACQVLMSTKSYIQFAERNGLETEKGNLLTNAESCYKYITKKLDFEEEHTGLADVEIECEIMAECHRKHKKNE